MAAITRGSRTSSTTEPTTAGQSGVIGKIWAAITLITVIGGTG